MSLSIYDASVPVFLRAFGNFSAILDKGAAFARETGLSEADLVGARLAPDMLTLAGQVQRASDSAKGAAARLAGRDIPSFPDDEATFADLQARIAKTTDFLKGFSSADFEGAAERPVTIKTRGAEVTMRGADYLLRFALPNVFFHVTTGYDILRHKGVAIGKMDYIGSL